MLSFFFLLISFGKICFSMDIYIYIYKYAGIEKDTRYIRNRPGSPALVDFKYGILFLEIPPLKLLAFSSLSGLSFPHARFEGAFSVG